MKPGPRFDGATAPPQVTERSNTMGDKGGKKDKLKDQKQKTSKHDQKAKKKSDKQPKRAV